MEYARSLGLKLFELPSPYICYVSWLNSFVVMPDGTLSKCMVRLYDDVNGVGELNNDGTLTIDEDKLLWWARRIINNDLKTTAIIIFLLIISIDILSYSVLSLYYNVALLASIDNVFGLIGAVLGSMLTPRFRVDRLNVIYVLAVTALIIRTGFGVIPITIRSLIIAVPLLFITNLVYNIFINAFFTAIGSALIYVTPRSEFGIVYSSAWAMFTVAQVLSAVIWAFIGTAIGAPEALLLAMVMGVIVFLALNAVYGKVSLKD
ncbi:hypothetical protein VMUT_1878 [Vulcanisaeta moutnovskia 768-28]|uniref:Uncharacterized protein n=1 Tax=Vulcanisaeta moutnovskia (strain 768-28) TaxID=985053 RepID=F0QVQ5_VULM7|nr:hypothetical protein [Vulcanisaeta moutnovskia]ADY02079.1 hypothetical protein VMUT_1878 [Vulcanisaeta moutnovskia 768-28]